jgi:hypothetical protein
MSDPFVFAGRRRWPTTGCIEQRAAMVMNEDKT